MHPFARRGIMGQPATHKPEARRAPLPSCTAAVVLVTAVACFSPRCHGADLTPEADKAFQHYIQLTEDRRKTQDSSNGAFLAIDASAADKENVRNGAILIIPRKTLDGGEEIKIPEALVQDWLGSMFVPNTNIAQVRSVMQAYPEYKKYFTPEVIDSKTLSNDGDHYKVFLRLYKKQIITVVFNTTYDITYTALEGKRLTIDSRSTRIAEAKNPKGPYDEEYPPGHDTGFLWRLNAYWRMQEADGGVYAQCEAISLSRDVPFGLFLIRRFVERFPKESMQHTLEGVKQAVLRP